MTSAPVGLSADALDGNALRGEHVVLQGVHVGGSPVDAPQGVGRDVAADHQQVAAEFLHDVEFALGPVQVALAPAMG